MGRITQRAPVLRVRDGVSVGVRADVLAVEEPLEIRVAGEPLTITMRTPGHDVELALGLLLAEGIIPDSAAFRSAIHCGGPGTSGGSENTYNVLDVSLTSPARLPHDRSFITTSACGVCGKNSIDAVQRDSAFDLTLDATRVPSSVLSSYPDRLRDHQDVFERTGGLHAAGLFDVDSDELLVVREDVGRHNAVDKVIGWAAQQDRLPIRGTVLQVSGRASFELVQKAVMAGIPVLSAVSAPSSLAVQLAGEAGLTLAGFVRGASMNVYTHRERIDVDEAPR